MRVLEEYFSFLSNPIWPAMIFYLSPAIVSVVFFRKDKNENRLIHYAVSLHGAIFVTAFFFSWFVNFMDWSNDTWPVFLNITMLLATASLIFSFFKFTGNKQNYLLHLITIAIAPFMWFAATMLITDRFL